MSFVQGKGVTPKGERYNRSFLVKDSEKNIKKLNWEISYIVLVILKQVQLDLIELEKLLYPLSIVYLSQKNHEKVNL